MVNFQIKLFIILVFFISNSISIAGDIKLNRLNYCKISKARTNNYEPQEFQSTNNLLRKTGEEEMYCGEKIIVHGRVLDENCVPVSDAVIYAWQVNCKGKYPYKPLKTKINDSLWALDSNNSFVGNGMAITNNKGEFHFVTVYPNKIHNKSPHINIRVKHRNMESLQTTLTLRGNKVKHPMLNPELSSVSNVAVQNHISIYDFQIVIPGKSIKSY